MLLRKLLSSVTVLEVQITESTQIQGQLTLLCSDIKKNKQLVKIYQQKINVNVCVCVCERESYAKMQLKDSNTVGTPHPEADCWLAL